MRVCEADLAAGRIYSARGSQMGQGPPARLQPRREDGGLIGGASLKPDQFVDIINAANQE